MSASMVPHPSSRPAPTPTLLPQEKFVQVAAHDFIFALSDAYNRKDLSAILTLKRRISLCVEALTVVERMALDFMDRTER